ncbi:hypothetical protein OG946_22880 [Streptomyces sp. NBC_01808]|uniref:hypothetical protein n=1 Tax=Streptomyces sp. NBC_01808 TaxID=2975947 RepID=UPI002DDBAA2B|nr:hypothetical protein [Streptomyces sp. NBC_01808]WSA39962.1 hypothetical protein OG946_22880 [Streptomyces sp. NBC_01808]
MHFLRPLVTFPRVVRHYSWVGADLPLDEDVLLDAPGHRVRAVLTAAEAGDFRPARELLAGAGRAAEWERRDTYVAELATAALDDGGWLRRWREWDPQCGDAAVVEAERLLRAWRVERYGPRRRRFEGWGVRRRGGAVPGPWAGAGSAEDAGAGGGDGAGGAWSGVADAESWPWYGVPGAGPGYGRPGSGTEHGRPGTGTGAGPGAGAGADPGAGPGVGPAPGDRGDTRTGPGGTAGTAGPAGAAGAGGGRRSRGPYGAGGLPATDPRAVLRDVLPLVRLAAAQAPGDPVPWRIALEHATAVRAPREAFVSRFAEAVVRAPGHHGAHVAALHYLAIVGDADVEELMVFAEESAEEALPGSLLHALPLEAASLGVCRARSARSGGPDPAAAPGSSTTWAVERALELSAHYEPGDPEAAGFRNCLAAALVRARRWDEALEVFRAVGSDARGVPWAHPGDDAEAIRRRFLLARQEVRAQLARRVPLFGPRPDNAPGPGAAFGPAGTGARPEPAPYAGIVVCTAPPAAVARAAHAADLRLRLTATGGARTCAQLRTRQRPEPGRAPVRVPGRAAGRWPRGRTAAGEPPSPDALLAAAAAMTRGEGWPAVALYAADGAAGIAVYRGGERTAEFTWRASGAAVAATVRDVAQSASPGGGGAAAPGGPERAPRGGTGRVAQFAEVRDTAEAIAAALAVADARPLTGVLRTAGTRRPRSTLAEALQALDLAALAPLFAPTPADPPSRPTTPQAGPDPIS